MELESPAKLKPISARYTCDGADISPPLHWKGVPADTKELDLFIFTLPGNTVHVPDWAVAGISPTVHELSAGQLPPGAIVGDNSKGEQRYTICPAKGSSAQYLIHLYALPQSVPTRPGFDANALRKQILALHLDEGLLEFSYARR